MCGFARFPDQWDVTVTNWPASIDVNVLNFPNACALEWAELDWPL